MKRLKLRNWVKVTLAIIVLVTISILFLKIATDRVDAINNGTLTVVSESEMAERN